MVPSGLVNRIRIPLSLLTPRVGRHAGLGGKDDMTTRTDLQGKSIKDLRAIADAIGIETQGLQKAKLIGQILGHDDFEVSDEPAPVDLPVASVKEAETPAQSNGGRKNGAKDGDETGGSDEPTESDSPKAVSPDDSSVETKDSDTSTDEKAAGDVGGDSDGGSRDDESENRNQGSQRRDGQGDQRDQGRDDGQGGRNRNRKRRRRGGAGGGGGAQQDDVPESEMEVREGILDVLPEGFGFMRCTGYTPGDKDVYVSASQIRKFGLRRGDMVVGPVRAPRSQEKFAALTRIVSVNDMDVEEARRRPKFEKLTPLFPDERLRLEVDDRPDMVLTRIIDLIAPIGKGQRGLIVSPPEGG